MSQLSRVSHRLYDLPPTEIEGFDSLAELALDMRWSWNHATDVVWRQLDPELWEVTHNPWVVLQTVSRDRIERALRGPRLPEKRREFGRNPSSGGGKTCVVSAKSSECAPDLRRLFQHGIHAE